MTCSYRTCGNELPTARLPERSESVRLSGTLCRVLAVLAVAGVRRRHPVAGLTNRDPGEQKHVITGRLVDWATRDGGGAGQAADAVRSVLDEFLPGRYLSSVLSGAPRKQRSDAERTAARGHGERTQTRSGQRAGHRRPRSRPGARAGGPVRRLREGGPSNPTHRAPARDRRRVHRRPSRHPQGRPGPGEPGHSGPRRRTMPATYADRRLQAMPRSVAPALSRPRPEHAPYRRICRSRHHAQCGPVLRADRPVRWAAAGAGASIAV